MKLSNKKIAKNPHYFSNTLSYFVYLRTYAGWLDKEKRRETWPETVSRYMDFMREHCRKKFTEKEYAAIHKAILQFEVMPSMRLIQFAGPAVRNSHVYAYNCSYVAPTTIKDLAEVLYISMCGCGVGFSVESQNIQKFPIIKKQSGTILPKYIVSDSKEGWCRAFIKGLNAWFNGADITFDFSKLRPAGARIKKFGGHSSGPDPLKALLEYSKNIILKRQGKRLHNIDIYDILCKIGQVVVASGVRRSAMLSLSDLDDAAMRDAKKGLFYHSQPQRSYANNSAAYDNKPNNEVLLEEWLALAKSGSGERGIFNRSGLMYNLPKRRVDHFRKKNLINDNKISGFIGTNPCGEIILQSKQFCNLSEIIARPNDNLKSLMYKIKIAAMIGTYQASLTDFPFLSPEWGEHCKAEALLGVSITGQWDCPIVRNPQVLAKLKLYAIKINKIYAQRLNINSATAVTCIKPSGTVSLIANCSSGMHPRYAPYYLRRIRISANDTLFRLLRDQGAVFHPEVGYTLDNSPTFVIDFPMRSAAGGIYRNQLTALQQLDYWQLVKKHYTEHNPSVTISVGKNEWVTVLNWLDQHWQIIGGLSFLPRFEDVYRLAPYQEISKDEYLRLEEIYNKIDFSKLPEYE